MSYNSSLPANTTAPEEIRENFRALKEDKIVAAASATTADSATKLANARTIGITGDATGSATFDGSADVSISVDVTSADSAAACTGNAATATKLETARSINGVAFDGTKDITITVGVPAGAVQYFACQAVPSGWLKADSSAVSRTDYADLFNAIGTTYGKGDGSTTFNLPDLRGEFVRGYDNGRGVDSGREFGSSQGDAFKSHSHAVPVYGYDGSNQAVANDPGKKTGGSYGTLSAGGTETRPRNIALLACIKY
jgi:microcystin-dependent protein